LVAEHVDFAQAHGAGVGILERGERAHERRFAGSVRAEEAEHPGLYREGHVAERLDARSVALREPFDAELHVSPRRATRARNFSELRSAGGNARLNTTGPEQPRPPKPAAAAGRDPAAPNVAPFLNFCLSSWPSRTTADRSRS